MWHVDIYQYGWLLLSNPQLIAWVIFIDILLTYHSGCQVIECPHEKHPMKRKWKRKETGFIRDCFNASNTADALMQTKR